ncbi:MAG: UDP-glucose 4-epimerase GalE [Defluviitaleaceae bacterium]|nr:UDP-glucose 4-epimerase GalE [Defluviitaleaceae bacterium]
MAILVTGGAGYVGSHTVAALIERGMETIVVDNLEKGHKEAIWPGAKFYEGDLCDTPFTDKLFAENPITAVVHFAAYSLVAESVANPAMYYDNNVVGTLQLLKAMNKHNVRSIVFSSTAATYGEPEAVPVTECAPERPVNPYGESKLAVERMLKWFDGAYDIKHVILRYFNVAGAHESAKIGEDHNPETHLIPMILQTALGKRESFDLYGDDYKTPDGTCIRDYIHATDLADAHILALEKLKKEPSSALYNLGSGSGFSNKEILLAAKKITGIDIPVRFAPRRAGDPPVLVASSDKIKKQLGWNPTRTHIDNIIRTAWAWHSANPDGFKSKTR